LDGFNIEHTLTMPTADILVPKDMQRSSIHIQLLIVSLTLVTN